MEPENRENCSKNELLRFVGPMSGTPSFQEIPNFLGREGEPAHLSSEFTPCKRDFCGKSFRSSPLDSIANKFSQFSPFFTSLAKTNHSPVSPHTWNRLSSQTKPARGTPLDRFFQQSDLKILLPLDLNMPEGPSLILDAFLTQPSFLEAPRLELNTLQAPRPESGGCNCRNSRCLKLYCECFKKNQTCNGCNCIGCENHEGSAFRNERIRFVEKRNPFAFQPPLIDAKAPGGPQHQKGCNCHKSHCLKNYCECHQLGALCGEFCKCKDCHNVKKDSRRIPRSARKTKSE